MQSLLLQIRRAFCAANGVVLVDDRFDAQARTFFRSPFRSFCVGAVSGAMSGSAGALVAPEMLLGLTLMFAIWIGLLGAAMAGLSRWEHSATSASCVRLPYGPRTERKLRRARLALAAVPTAICLAAALLSQRPFVVFMLSAALLLVLIAMVGIVALVVEFFGTVRTFTHRKKIC